ncbi:MAG: hypothetical protein QM610_07345 [Chitinophagaceae bacterium]
MKWQLMILCFLFCCQASVWAQQDTAALFQKRQTINGCYASFSVDNLGNVYALSLSGNQLKKMAPNGDSLGIFNDVKQYGNIYGMDVSNPLKLLLYYRSFATIIVLDRFLNNINKIDLRQAGILQAKAVCQSYDNQVWVFDQQECKLKKVGENCKMLFSSDDFRVIFNLPFNPTTIVDHDGSLYLYDEAQGWTVMDYYGAVKKEYPSPHWKNIGVYGKILYGWNNQQLCLLNLDNYVLKTYNLPIDFQNIKSLCLLDGRLYVLDDGGIGVYSIQ